MGSKKFLVFWIVIASMAMATIGTTMEDDEKECAEQMANLAACIPFVSGTAKKPTAECCENTKKVKAEKPKCLCVLIKESTDPSMGLPVNTTLALQMPSACNIDGNVSDCPSILKLAPNSPDAKIFTEADDPNSSISPPTSASTSSSSSGSSSAGGSDSKSDSKTTPSNVNSGSARLMKLTRTGYLLLIMVVSMTLIMLHLSG